MKGELRGLNMKTISSEIPNPSPPLPVLTYKGSRSWSLISGQFINRQTDSTPSLTIDKQTNNQDKNFPHQRNVKDKGHKLRQKSTAKLVFQNLDAVIDLSANHRDDYWQR